MEIYSWRKYEIEILDYDSDTSVLWLRDGIGLEYWINDALDIELEGTYVAEGITGEYHRGNRGWGEDDDESWYCELIRRATEEEIKTEALI